MRPVIREFAYSFGRQQAQLYLAIRGLSRRPAREKRGLLHGRGRVAGGELGPAVSPRSPGAARGRRRGLRRGRGRVVGGGLVPGVNLRSHGGRYGAFEQRIVRLDHPRLSPAAHLLRDARGGGGGGG